MPQWSCWLALQVLYRTSSQTDMNVLSTDKTTAELLLQFHEDYIIEVKATTDGGDGTSSDRILIPRLASRLKLNPSHFVTCLRRVPCHRRNLLSTSHGIERHVVPYRSQSLPNLQLTHSSCHSLSLQELSPY